MKTSTRALFFRITLLTCAALAAFLIGRWRKPVQTENPSEGTSLLAGKSNSSKDTGRLAESFLSADEVSHRLLASLSEKKFAEAKKELAEFLVFDQIRITDIPVILKALDAIPSGEAKLDMMYDLLLRLEGSDPKTTLSLAGKLTNSDMRSAVIGQAIRDLAKISPEAAMAEVAKLPPGHDMQTGFDYLFDTWATKDPQGAVAAAMTLPEGEARQAAFSSIADYWSDKNPQAVLNWAASLQPPNPKLVDLVMEQVSLNHFDQKFLLANLDKVTDPEARGHVVSAVAGAMFEKDPANALDWLGQVETGRSYDDEVRGLFDYLSGKNPAQAVALLPKITDPNDRSAIINNLAKTWGGTDAAAALAWAQGLPDADKSARTAALNSIVKSWGANDPAAAVAFIQNSGDLTTYLAIVPGLAQGLSKSDPQAALTWVNTLPDGAAKAQAQSNVLVNLSATDFPAAWTYATALPDGAGRDGAMTSLVDAQVKSDPAKAVVLLSQFAPGPALQNATRDLAYAWIRQDPQAASTWMTTLPDGPQRNAAVAQLVGAQAAKDPAGSLEWANTMTNQPARITAIQKVFTAWAKTDPEAALAALPSAKIPPAESAALQQTILQAKAASHK